MIESPVFLVGAERSGTTLLRLMLSHHPQLTFISEFNFITDAMTPEGNPPTDRRFVRQLERDRCFLDTKLALKPELGFVDHAHDLLEQARTRKGTDQVGATVHRNFDRLLAIWPEARFIHLVRDGRDVALSAVKMGWAGNAYTAIKTWVETEEMWARLAARLPEERHVTLAYEDLVPRPQQELARLCRFLGLDYDPAMLSYPGDTSYQPPNTRRVQAWRRANPKAIAAAEVVAGPWLERHGYPTANAHRRISPVTQVRLGLHHRWANLRFKHKRYSMPLWLQGVVARRMGTPRWRSHVRARMDHIDTLHLQ